MGKIQAKDRQSLLDILLIACGTLDGMIEVCALNGISLTDDLEEGQNIEVGDIVNNQMLSTYQTKGYCPATAIAADGIKRHGGIDYMAIGFDFIVS
jgi:hypothetical protein